MCIPRPSSAGSGPLNQSPTPWLHRTHQDARSAGKRLVSSTVDWEPRDNRPWMRPRLPSARVCCCCKVDLPSTREPGQCRFAMDASAIPPGTLSRRWQVRR